MAGGPIKIFKHWIAFCPNMLELERISAYGVNTIRGDIYQSLD